MLSFSSNADKLAQILAEKGEAFLPLLQKKWRLTTQGYISRIVKQQMSGRTGFAGLNRVTGALARSWFGVVTRSNGDLTANIGTDSKYAKVHQEGRTIHQGARSPLNINFKRVKGKGVRFAKASAKGAFSSLNRGIGTSKGRTFTIPKRLYVVEDFRDEGIKYFVQDVLDAMQEIRKS